MEPTYGTGKPQLWLRIEGLVLLYTVLVEACEASIFVKVYGEPLKLTPLDLTVIEPSIGLPAELVPKNIMWSNKVRVFKFIILAPGVIPVLTYDNKVFSSEVVAR